jgi:dTDP-4-dehydrorhamnose 3,5-epimerase
MFPGPVVIKDVIITHLDVIDTPGGNVMHGMKETSTGYVGFGEAYFSQVNKGVIKAWKRHKIMTLNLIVPVGKIRFVLFDDRGVTSNQFQEVIVSKDNYCRLTVPPMIWVGFQSLSNDRSILLNIANVEHNFNEVDREKISKINYDWSIS